MRHNLRLIKLEAITTFFVVGAVETLYLQTKGYTLGQIGVVNAIQIAFLMLANVPTGYLADRTSRKMCNLIGDALVAGGIIGFALADNLVWITLAKIITGLGLAMSLGADTTLLKAVCDHLGESFAKHQASNQSKMMALMVVGGVGVGIVTIRYPTTGIVLAAVPFILGAVISCFIKEVKAPAEPATKSLKKALWLCWTDKRVRWTILTGSVLGSLAGVVQYLAVPLARTGGVPAFIAGVAWSYYFLAWSLGAWLYKRMIDVWTKRTLLILPVSVVVAALGVAAIDVNRWTVSTFLLVGLAHGRLAPQLIIITTEAAPSELRATIISIYATVMQLTFIVAMLVVFNIATTNIAYAMTMAFLLFVPPILFGLLKLIRVV
jgi:DHA1 family quinolone resistance protein-like MFS transporter